MSFNKGISHDRFSNTKTPHPAHPAEEKHYILLAGTALEGAQEGETISAALFANGIRRLVTIPMMVPPRCILRQWTMCPMHGHCRWETC